MDTNNIVSSFSKPESISSKYDEKKVKVKEIGTCTNFAYPKFMQLDTEKVSFPITVQQLVFVRLF